MNVDSANNRTTLIRADDRGFAEIVSELVSAGAAIDQVNNLGWTVLLEPCLQRG